MCKSSFVNNVVCGACFQERDDELAREQQRQEENDVLRKQFAQHANAFHQWLTDTRQAMMEGTGTLESQLEATKVRAPARWRASSRPPR